MWTRNASVEGMCAAAKKPMRRERGTGCGGEWSYAEDSIQS